MIQDPVCHSVRLLFLYGALDSQRPSLRMLCRVAACCRPLRPVLLLVSFARSRSPVVGVRGLCWLVQGSFLGFPQRC